MRASSFLVLRPICHASLGLGGEGRYGESRPGRFQSGAFWGALEAMHCGRHGERGGGGALSFGSAGRASDWANLYGGLPGVPPGLRPVAAFATRG